MAIYVTIVGIIYYLFHSTRSSLVCLASLLLGPPAAWLQHFEKFKTQKSLYTGPLVLTGVHTCSGLREKFFLKCLMLKL